MAPILGIIASSTQQGLATDNGAMFPISSVVVPSAGAANITFSSIPSTYTHLQIRGIARSTLGATGAGFAMQVNSDTGANYAAHNLLADGTSVQTNSYTSNTYMYPSSYMPAANATASVFGAVIIDVLDYANSNKYKTMRSMYGTDLNGSGQTGIASSVWMSTSAITSVKLYFTSSNLAQYSSFALYGVKA
jgi:hypothetical protein